VSPDVPAASLLLAGLLLAALLLAALLLAALAPVPVPLARAARAGTGWPRCMAAAAWSSSAWWRASPRPW
jgi:hypothetical protein